MKRVKYMGEAIVHLPTLGVMLEYGDEVDVPDDFENALFILITEIEKGDQE